MVDSHNSIAEIRKILDDPEYMEFSNELIILSKNKMCADIDELEIEFVIECLNAAAMDIVDIQHIFHNDELRFWFFCFHFIESEQWMEVDQEFNPDDPMNDDEPSEETYIGHSRITVIQYAIYYYLLINDKSRLKLFFTKIRQPNPRKYAANIIEFFNKLQMQ